MADFKINDVLTYKSNILKIISVHENSYYIKYLKYNLPVKYRYLSKLYISLHYKLSLKSVLLKL